MGNGQIGCLGSINLPYPPNVGTIPAWEECPPYRGVDILGEEETFLVCHEFLGLNVRHYSELQHRICYGEDDRRGPLYGQSQVTSR